MSEPNYILSESITNTIVLYIILKKLMQDFEEWDAYKLGIIDKSGKKIKNPSSSKEREAWDLLTRFCWNFKKIIHKFVGKSKTVTYLSAAYLLKDSFDYFYVNHNKVLVESKYLTDITFEKQNFIFEFISEMSKQHKPLKINEENFEMEMFKILEKTEELLKTFDFEKVIL